MSTERESFSGHRLRIARGFAGLTQAALGEKVAVSHQFIGYLETGAKLPTEILVAALAEACGFESTFFFGPTLNEFRDEECHFRRRQTTPVSVRTRVLAHGTLFGQLIDHIDGLITLPKTRVPEQRADDREAIERAAEECRQAWGLGRDVPIKSVTRALENAGVVVTRFEGSAEKVDAFSRAGRRNIVVLNTDKGSPSRSRFDLSHECGHLVMHGGLETDTDLEKQADQFASAFLMPRAGFVREFPRSSKIDWPSMFRLKARWKVSLAALVRRAYDLRLIDAMQYQRGYKYIASKGWLKGEPEEFEAETPEIVPLAVAALEQKGHSAHAMRRDLGWSLETFIRVSGVEVEPEQPARNLRRVQ